MFESVTYALIFGKPLIMYLGILTLFSFLVTASVGLMNMKGITIVPFKWHPRLAVFSICLALIHGALGVLAYF
jgi:hypothetical protein